MIERCIEMCKGQRCRNVYQYNIAMSTCANVPLKSQLLEALKSFHELRAFVVRREGVASNKIS
jgi:hypothetical protein